MSRLFRRLSLFSLAALLVTCPSRGRAQTDMGSVSSERPPVTVLTLCTNGPIVGACYDFEGGTVDGWHIPDWAAESNGYGPGRVDLASDTESPGGTSLGVRAEFQAAGWSAIALELRTEVSLAEFSGIVARLRPPSDTTLRLSARFVLVAGPSWDWIETEKSIPLEAGIWSIAEAPLDPAAWVAPANPGAAVELEWTAYLADVHRIIIRIEANPDKSDPGPEEPTTIFVDDIQFPLGDGR